MIKKKERRRRSEYLHKMLVHIRISACQDFVCVCVSIFLCILICLYSLQTMPHYDCESIQRFKQILYSSSLHLLQSRRYSNMCGITISAYFFGRLNCCIEYMEYMKNFGGEYITNSHQWMHICWIWYTWISSVYTGCSFPFVCTYTK